MKKLLMLFVLSVLVVLVGVVWVPKVILFKLKITKKDPGTFQDAFPGPQG